MRTLRTVVLISAVFVVVGPVVGAGLLGCFLFFVFVSVFDLLIVSGWTVGDLEIRFLRRSIGAGIPAGTVCALLVWSRRSRS